MGHQPAKPPPCWDKSDVAITAAQRAYMEDRIDADELERRVDHALHDPDAAWRALAPTGSPLRPAPDRLAGVRR